MIPYSCPVVAKSVANVHFLLPDTSSPSVHISFVGVLVKVADPFLKNNNNSIIIQI
jgi:hypothetical protein